MCYEPKDTESMHGRAGGVARRGGSLKVMSKSLGLEFGRGLLALAGSVCLVMRDNYYHI